jgi:hypothetical protein
VGAKRSFGEDGVMEVLPSEAHETLEPGKRVRVMACSEEESDAGKLLLGFFNTVRAPPQRLLQSLPALLPL